MHKIIDTLIDIIENPLVKKVYRDLKKELLKLGMSHEAEAVEYLIEKKFNKNVTSGPSNTEK